jgi:hypothetical protein
MTKAWELKALVEELKGKGLDIAEDAAKHVVEAVFDWTEKSIELTENKIDDAVLLVLPKIKEAALKAADAIDGQKG